MMSSASNAVRFATRAVSAAGAGMGSGVGAGAVVRAHSRRAFTSLPRSMSVMAPAASGAGDAGRPTSAYGVLAAVAAAASLATGVCLTESDPAAFQDKFRHPRLIPMRNDQARKQLYNLTEKYDDFPKRGVSFEDVFPIFRSPEDVESMVDAMATFLQSKYGKIDIIVGLDARGFLFGPMLAVKLGCSFSPIRKKGKLPGKTIEAVYKKEYGEDVFEAQLSSFHDGARVVIVDDLLATGGTLEAAVKLIERANATVLCSCVMVELVGLRGCDRIFKPVYSMMRLQP